MVRISRPLALFPVLLVSLLGASQGQQKSPWNAVRVVESGVNVVKNPAEPLYGRVNLELREELSIGDENVQDYSFRFIWDIKADHQGNIYVADTRNLRIQKFDRKGIFISTLGKGLVEFEQPTKIRINESSGSVFVRASVLNIDVFDHKGEYASGIRLTDHPILEFEPIDDAHVMAVLSREYRDGNPRVMKAIYRLDSKDEMKRLSGEYFAYALEDIGMAWTSKGTAFDPDLYLSRLNQITYIYGYSKAYELNVIGQDGKLLYRITKSEPTPVFTSEERRVFRRYEFPDAKPYFFHLLADSMGRIYVQRNITKGILNAVQEKTQREVDIFSQDGCFLYTSTLPPNTCEIRNGYLYAYVVDKARGLEVVKRYRIVNWKELKD